MPRINLAEAPDFDLGGLRVSPAHREVRIGDDRRELEPKVAQVLVALASARGAVVSRDRLIEQCWDGRIVGDDALNRCIVALRQLAREFSPEPFAIETVSRVGYCLVERGASHQVARRRSRIGMGIAALLALLLVGGAITIGKPLWRGADAEPASIALVPFRNLSAGDSYFAEGIGEEILGQLSREPQFRVAGGTSSSQLASDADVQDVARRLNVDYIVEGSVRRQGDAVRVNADLVRASDGTRLWSDSYDGKLDDIFAIQRQIGGAIAGALSRRLVQAPRLSGPLVTNGDAYNLYLTARGLIRTRNRHVTATAANILRDAINLDPGYAPAWASLAEATYLEDPPDPDEGRIAGMAKAEGYARRALALAPNLAEAHRTLATVLIAGSPEAQRHFHLAAQLDPNSAENMVALGGALANEGKFGGELAAYRRAAELDRLWFRTTGSQGMALARRGDRAGAEAIARSGFAKDVNNQRILLGRIAWILGDYSEAVRHWSAVARSNSPRWSSRAQEDLGNVRAALGLASLSSARLGMRRSDRLWIDPPPSPDSWSAHNRNPAAMYVYRDHNQVAVKRMLHLAASDMLIRAYDGPVGLLGLRRGQVLRFDQVEQAPLVALVLRRAGRTAEADRLLREADAQLSAAYRSGPVPFQIDASAAAVRAVEGRAEDALAALERAAARGWTHTENADLRDLDDEPAFQSLHGQPRFAALRTRLAVHFAKERSEALRLRG